MYSFCAPESDSQLSVNSEILLSGFIKATILLTDNVKLALAQAAGTLEVLKYY